MKPLFPWEFSGELGDKFAGPFLFMALHRLYKNAYFGKGFKLIEKNCKDIELKERIEQLPVDVKRIIFSKIWDEGKLYGSFTAKGKDLLLDLTLLYLLSQFGN